MLIINIVTKWYNYIDSDEVDLSEHDLSGSADRLVRMAFRQSQKKRGVQPSAFIDWYIQQAVDAQRVIAYLEKDLKTPEALPPADEDESETWLHLSKDEIQRRADEQRDDM